MTSMSCINNVCLPAPSIDCWKCPVIKDRINIAEVIFRRNIDITRRLRDYIVKFSEILRSSFGDDYVFKIMDFCGTHEWTIVHFGVRTLMPSNVELVAGPGCPVCVTPSYYIEEAIRLALDGVVIYTYGDVFRLPALNPVKGAHSLAEARALGADVRIVHSIVHAALDAKRHGKDSLFLGIGFETVAPGYAEAMLKGLLPNNLRLMSLVKLTPPAAFYSLDILREKPNDYPVMGVIAPGHVSTIIGGKAWTPIAENYGIPVVVAIAEILRQLARGEAKVVIEYTRAVRWEGDVKAQSSIRTVFETVDSAWRGIGYIPKSGLALRPIFERYDAFTYFGIKELTPEA